MRLVGMAAGLKVGRDPFDFGSLERALAAELADQGKGDRVHGAATYATNV